MGASASSCEVRQHKLTVVATTDQLLEQGEQKDVVRRELQIRSQAACHGSNPPPPLHATTLAISIALDTSGNVIAYPSEDEMCRRVLSGSIRFL